MGFFRKRKPRDAGDRDENRILRDKITAMEQELAQLKAMLEAKQTTWDPRPSTETAPAPQLQDTPIQEAPAPEKPAPAAVPVPRAEEKKPRETGWFDMIEHPGVFEARGCLETLKKPVELDVILYGADGAVLSTKTFFSEADRTSYSSGQISVWHQAEGYAATLIRQGVPMRNRTRRSQFVENGLGVYRDSTVTFPVTLGYLPAGIDEEFRHYDKSRLDEDKAPGWRNVFFGVGVPVLLDSSGDWETDIRTAKKRMDEYFSTSGTTSAYREEGRTYSGSWMCNCYDCEFSSWSVSSTHDGSDFTFTKMARVTRISPQEFYFPRETRDANVLIESGMHHYDGQSEYYLKHRGRRRIRNFLGMAGYFEINIS